MNLTSKRILVIDDNPSLHLDYRKILCPELPDHEGLDKLAALVLGEPESASTASFVGQSFMVDGAYQGQEGFEMVQRSLEEDRPYCMAFVDIRMPPGWDGIETVKRIWEVDPSLQVVLCSAYSDYSWRSIINELGESDRMLILRKPFDNVEVLQMAHALTRKWETDQRLSRQLEDLDRVVAERTRELKDAYELLQSSEERFSKAFYDTPLPLAIIQLPDLRWIDVNTALCQLSGYKREDFLSESVDPVQLIQFAEIRLDEHLALEPTTSAAECSLRIQGHHSTRRVLLDHQFMSIGDTQCVLITLQDISEKCRIEEQLRQAQKMEAVGQLAAGIAHDFNNIMTVILGHIGLHKDDPTLSDALQFGLEEIENATKRASGLVKQLLAFSRKQLLSPKPLQLGALFGQQSEMLERLIGEHIELIRDWPDELPFVNVDPGSVEQILLNLAINARDAMPDGGRLRLQAREVELTPANIAEGRSDAIPGQFVEVTVADNGCGIPAGALNRIFDPFFSTKDVGKGTGLGLATVYGLIKQQGGWIEVRSEISVGTEFTFFLPVTSPPEPVLPLMPQPQDWNSQSKGSCVLIVEDDPSLRQILQALLQRLGLTVMAADSGPSALELWNSNRDEINLVITDIVMPGGISGLELGRRLELEQPDLKIIYSSGYSADLISGNHHLSVSSNFLPKPYDVKQLTRLLNNDQPDPKGEVVSEVDADLLNVA